MIGAMNVRKLVSFCSVVLGLLLVYSVVPPLVVEGSDAVAGYWYPVYENDSCLTVTTLWCSNGAPNYGIHCTGPSFQGVVQAYPNLGHVHLLDSAGCQTTGWDSGNCLIVKNSQCNY